MRTTYLLIGIVVILISVFILKGKLEIYNVERDGKLVDMEVIKMPYDCSLTRGKYYMNTKYQQVTFIKKIPSGYCNNHKVGDIIKMKYLEGYNYILFPDESLKRQFIAIAIFIFVGILVVIYGCGNMNIKR